MAEEEKEPIEPTEGADGQDAAQKAAEAARARLAENPWTENPDAAHITDEDEKAPEPPRAPENPPATTEEEPPERDEDEENSEPEAEDDSEGNMSILRHLEELRTRIIRSLIAVAIGSGIAYFFIEDIMRYLTLPAGGRLYYLQPAEAFFTYIKIALFAGFLLALPVIFYQGWKFILPALTVRERTVIGILVPSSVLLFFGGLAFSFFLVLPAALQFFVGFSTENLQPMFTLHQYFDFVLAFILPFGAVFELPLLVIVFAKLGFIGSEFLQSKQRIVIFLSFVVGAVISPTPDMFTQSMIAIPLVLLYELSYLVVRFVLRR
ncbi:MAG: twin-arginine translocase subunit TatC [Schwartzia sp.]|nr:twin-arginine translocase subunit TatC [Schwartzia sp. (in: firmicutes)]